MAVTPDQVGMTPDQIYSLWSDAVKIGLPAIIGAIGGGATAWFAARRAFKIKNAEHAFEKEKSDLEREFQIRIDGIKENNERDRIKYERDKELIFTAIERIETYHNKLSTIVGLRIPVLIIPEDTHLTQHNSALSDYNKSTGEFNSIGSSIYSTIALIGNDGIDKLKNDYMVACNDLFQFMHKATTYDELSNIDFGPVYAAKAVLTSKLSSLFRQII